VDADSGANLFVPSDDGRLLSDLGQQFVAGLLAHAASSCLLTTPTVTGYKRYRARAIAPDRISWSSEHRGAMLRIIGGPGDPATRIENRAGDPAANPYLFVASQLFSGLDGIERELLAGQPTESPYEAEGGELLPRTLGEAIHAFETCPMYREALGDDVVTYLAALKRSEWNRFLAAVTDWEQSEYFELF
jgi:glutamine synthetase